MFEMRARTLLLVGLAVATFSERGHADVVPSFEERQCPEGHTRNSDHEGQYCEPPPPESCPPGYEPKTQRHRAVCEPPPERPCPVGSVWRRGQCLTLTASCEVHDCPSGTCVPVSYCMMESCFRCGFQRVGATCNTQQDCPANPQSGCLRQFICEPPFESKRKPADYPGGFRDYDLPESAPDPDPLPATDVARCPHGSCPLDTVCLPLQWCIDTRQTPREPSVVGSTPVTGSCARGKGCPEGSHCSRAFRCVERSSVAAAYLAEQPRPGPLDLPAPLPEVELPKPATTEPETGDSVQSAQAPAPTPTQPPPEPGCSRCATFDARSSSWGLLVVTAAAASLLGRRRRSSGAADFEQRS